MRRYLLMKGYFFLMALILGLTSRGQSTFLGRVVDDLTGKPIAGVIITSPDSLINTESNALGYFQIVSDSAKILFTKGGFQAAHLQLDPAVPNFQVRLKLIPLDVEFEVHNIEDLPEFPGGMSAFYKFIGENMSYPKEARRRNIQGLVYVQFVVASDGDITEVNVVKGIGGGCDEEAKRVVSMAPNFILGTHDGENVPMRLTVPISFKISM